MKWFRSQEVETAEEPHAPRGASRTQPPVAESKRNRVKAEKAKGASAKPTSGKESKSDKESREFQLDMDGWWKPFWTCSALVMFVGVLWGISNHVWRWLDQPVTEVSISGQVRHLDKMQLAQTIVENLQEPLLSVDISTIQNLVSEQPWVRVAGITRAWPAALEVMVEEEVPVARWGEKGLLNHQGDIFWPELKSEYADLPRLSGPAPDTERVMSQFHDLNQMFRSVGLQVTRLDLEARGAWTLELDNQIKVVVGREAINERLQRFLVLYQQRLAAQAAEIEQVDIRYTHGMAVKWRAKPEDEKAG